MKKLLILLISILSTLTLGAKCDWSKVSLSYANKSSYCFDYTFEINGITDTCFKSETTITNKKTGSKNIISGRRFIHTFSDTGEYTILVKVYNKCFRCDTTIENVVYVRCLRKLNLTNEPLSKSLVIRPNPASQSIYVDIESGSLYSIYDLSGRLVSSGLYDGHSLEIGHLKNGVYYLNTEFGSSSFIVNK